MTARKKELQIGYVYLICNPATDFYKIGSSRRPTRRLCSIRSTRSACVMLHTIATNAALRLEREWQDWFRESCVGGEWFALTAEQVREFCSASVFFYDDAEWQPRSHLRSDFDAGAPWAARLPVAGN